MAWQVGQRTHHKLLSSGLLLLQVINLKGKGLSFLLCFAVTNKPDA
jgi:hypothetical protein